MLYLLFNFFLFHGYFTWTPVFTAIWTQEYLCGRAFFVWIRIAVRTGSTLVPVFTAILRLKRCYSNLETQDVTAIWSLFILDHSIP